MHKALNYRYTIELQNDMINILFFQSSQFVDSILWSNN